MKSHLGENAPDGPDVDWAGVLVGAEQDLGSAVPQGDDLVRVDADRDAEGPGEAKVGDLDGAALVDEQVLGLEVPVEDAPLVAEEHALQESNKI